MKKIWGFLSSMRFAIGLLIVLAVACAVGSLIVQGQSPEWYVQRYGTRGAALITALHMDDAYHSAWFIVISAALCLNLLLCNVLRLPQLLRRTRDAGSPDKLPAGTEPAARGVRAPEAVFTAMRMPSPARGKAPDGRETLVSVRHRPGYWGAWVCHLGILLLILGFTLGQMTRETWTVYGVAGQTKPVGDTGLSLTIDDFTVFLREDDTVEQYRAEITVSDGGDARSAAVSVNHPADLFGLKFYQNSTGWAATAHVEKDGEPLQTELLCVGEILAAADKPELVVLFNAFYPDYVLMPGEGPMTMSGRLNNPAYLYSAYYEGRMLGMGVLTQEESVLTIDEYTVTFSDPESYTLIQVKRDAFTPLALLGGLITTLGLFLAFGLQPARMWALRETDGSGWTLYAESRRGGSLFDEELSRALERTGEARAEGTAVSD